MKYLNSERVIHVGDKVVYGGSSGVVVFVIDDDSYSDKYKKENWSYLGKGLGVELQDGTLYHLDSPDEDLRVVM
jgi:hypothetical protein